jgi:hypothetical protein
LELPAFEKNQYATATVFAFAVQLHSGWPEGRQSKLRGKFLGFVTVAVTGQNHNGSAV